MSIKISLNAMRFLDLFEDDMPGELFEELRAVACISSQMFATAVLGLCTRFRRNGEGEYADKVEEALSEIFGPNWAG